MLIFKDQFCAALVLGQYCTELILKNTKAQQPQHRQEHNKQIPPRQSHAMSGPQIQETWVSNWPILKISLFMVQT